MKWPIEQNSVGVLLTNVDVSPRIHILHPPQDVQDVLLTGLSRRYGRLTGVQGISEVVQDKLRMESSDIILAIWNNVLIMKLTHNLILISYFIHNKDDETSNVLTN